MPYPYLVQTMEARKQVFSSDKLVFILSFNIYYQN